jgi:hypothetical protein
VTEAHRDGALEQARAAFEIALNRHGYPFQYAVLRRAKELREAERSRFIFEVAEFPVSAGDASTRIDFVLKHQDARIYLVCECKRANPAVANWCFARAPYMRRGRGGDPFIHELLTLHSTSRALGPQATAGVMVAQTFDAASIGIEVRTQVKGDARGAREGAIEEAATQVMRGLNGLISFVQPRESFFGEQFRGGEIALSFIPVVFTTATLYLTSADLQTTDVETGRIDLSTAPFERKGWLGYQYHQGPQLKHGVRRGVSSGVARSGDLGAVLDTEFVRTIPIVSPVGIDEFLRWATNLSELD